MTPAVAGDAVYVGSCAGTYYALSIDSGSVLWSFDFTKDVGHATFHGDPLLHEGLVITGTESLTPVHARAFSQGSGRTVWTRSGDMAFTRSDVIGVGGMAVGRNDDGELIALDAVTGAPLWRVSHEGRRFRPDVAESPAARDSAIVFSAPDGAVYQVSADSGVVRWRRELDCDVSTSVAFETTGIYIGCSNGRLFRLSPENGTVIDSMSLDQTLEGRLLVLEDRIVVPGGTSWIGAVDLRLDRILWERADLPRLSVVQPIVYRGRLITGTAAGALLALNPADGRTVWSQALEGSIRGLGAHGDLLLVGTIQGTVYVLRPVAF